MAYHLVNSLPVQLQTEFHVYQASAIKFSSRGGGHGITFRYFLDIIPIIKNKRDILLIVNAEVITYSPQHIPYG